MQRIEFVNDLRCNYLTIPYEGGEGDFALRMLMGNITDGFLPMELRRLDGQAYLYYNISGMQNMEIIYAEKTIDREAFQNFIWHLHDAIEQSRELFLPGDGICLEPSLIFWNLGTQRWEFAYVPKSSENEVADMQRNREELAEFLVMRIDYEDKKLTEVAYRFYEEICAGRMEPDIFWEKEEMKEKEEKKTEQRQEIEEDCVTDDWEIEEPEELMRESERNTEMTMEKERESNGMKKILLILWCATVAVTFLLGRTRQEIILPGGAIAVLLTVLLLFIQIRQKRSRQEAVPEKTDMIYVENKEIPYSLEDREPEKEAEEEKTVYMDIRQEQERKLYGVGKFRKEKIFLGGLPCTIGKDKTLVNHIISDSSVSRMHARFFTEEENLWMQDLNSTNGTYHNGLRLRPNEKVILEPEDEVGFGRVQFVFR